jgi:FtsZ-interacting cell division protein ZipA
MSELQAALLAIGVGVVVAVYALGWWKQRQYGRKFGAAFKLSHDDALYQANTAQTDHKIEPFVLYEGPVQDAVTHEIVIPAHNVSEAVVIVADATPVTTAPVSTPGDPCAFLDIRSNFIFELRPEEPCAAAALEGLWQRQFAFRKPLQVCGLTLNTGIWESVNSESQTLYSQFRAALQLVDRSGVISLAKLGEFRNLVLGIAQAIHAETVVPDVQEAHRVAQELDALCAEVDQMVGVNLLPAGTRMLNGAKIAEAAARQGMTLEPDGVFHLLNAHGHSLITLINQDAKPFQAHALTHFSTAGITLVLDVPRVENPTESFDLLVKTAHSLARELQVNLMDDHRVQLTDAGLARIRTQISSVEAKMCANKLVPGSEQALRLFS